MFIPQFQQETELELIQFCFKAKPRFGGVSFCKSTQRNTTLVYRIGPCEGVFLFTVVSASLYLHSPWSIRPSTPRSSPTGRTPGVIYPAHPTMLATCAASPNYPAVTPRCGEWRPAQSRGRSILASVLPVARVGQRLALSKPLAASMSSSSPLSATHLAVAGSLIRSRYITSRLVTSMETPCMMSA